MDNKIGFDYGLFGDTLAEQATKLGYTLACADKFEKIRKAINMVGFHVATESQANMMFKKLHKQVTNSLLSPITGKRINK